MTESDKLDLLHGVLNRVLQEETAAIRPNQAMALFSLVSILAASEYGSQEGQMVRVRKKVLKELRRCDLTIDDFFPIERPQSTAAYM